MEVEGWGIAISKGVQNSVKTPQVNFLNPKCKPVYVFRVGRLVVNISQKRFKNGLNIDPWSKKLQKTPSREKENPNT